MIVSENEKKNFMEDIVDDLKRFKFDDISKKDDNVKQLSFNKAVNETIKFGGKYKRESKRKELQERQAKLDE